MEQFVAPVPGRTKPRWSRLLTGAAEQTVSSPLLIAGLNHCFSAMVCVGPPLFWGPVGSRKGFLLQNEVPVVQKQPVPVKPHVVPSSMLWPPSMTPAQLPPEVLLATIVLVTVTGPPMAPPLLPEKVLLVTVSVPPSL
jgi:hypothetical protein